MTTIDDENNNNDNNNVAPPVVPYVNDIAIPIVLYNMNEDMLLVFNCCGAIIVVVAMMATMIFC